MQSIQETDIIGRLGMPNRTYEIKGTSVPGIPPAEQGDILVAWGHKTGEPFLGVLTNSKGVQVSPASFKIERSQLDGLSKSGTITDISANPPFAPSK